ncbi:MAG: hypothetical protein ABL898_03350 [Hyphomicrobiaceae bacterium]
MAVSRRSASLFAATVIVGFCIASLPASAADPRDCFEDLQRGTSPEIVCNFPVVPSEKERAELEKQTKGYVKNANCTVAIRIDRALIMSVLANPDHVFQAPPQPVQCNVTTQLRKDVATTPIKGTFAPRVVFKGGEAVEASPGMANVEGVSRVLSWPVVTYVNNGGMVRKGMLQVVNAWVQHMRKQQQAAR